MRATMLNLERMQSDRSQNGHAHSTELLTGSNCCVHEKQTAAEHPAHADDQHGRWRDAARGFLRAPSAVALLDAGLPLRQTTSVSNDQESGNQDSGTQKQ